MTLVVEAPNVTNPASVRGAEDRVRDEAVGLTGIVKSYTRGSVSTPVLKGCSLSVRRGECVYLLGPSGSGKTTLLSIIGCVLRPDAGEVRIMGRDVNRLSRGAAADLRRTHIGFVFQRFHLMRGLSALENVVLPLVLAGVARSAAERRGRDLLARVGLADKMRSDPRQLSVGQCQRVALARALVADPPLVLADEPTAALDAEMGQAAMQVLRALTVEVGKTAIVVTHDPRIEAFADRTFVMEGGRIAAHAMPAGVARPPHPEAAASLICS
jgi:putative ABC transport system ATP-binding protein